MHADKTIICVLHLCTYRNTDKEFIINTLELSLWGLGGGKEGKETRGKGINKQTHINK